MFRTVLLATLLSIAVSGCASQDAPDPVASLDTTEPDRTTPRPVSDMDAEPGPTPDADVPSRREVSGTSRQTEVAACPPGVDGCVGYWSWDLDDPIRLDGNATERFLLNVTWDAVASDLQTLEIVVFEGSFMDGHKEVAAVVGTTPLSLVLERDDLADHRGPLGVAFRGDGPVSAQWEQEIDWTAVVFSR